MTVLAQIRELLATTSLPFELVQGLLEEASPCWLHGERAEVLAADLALCHPPLGEGELRVLARPTTRPRLYRCTVVARPRPTLMADLEGAFDAHELLITKSTATGCAKNDLMVLAVTVLVPNLFSPGQVWAGVSETIRQATEPRRCTT